MTSDVLSVHPSEGGLAHLTDATVKHAHSNQLRQEKFPLCACSTRVNYTHLGLGYITDLNSTLAAACHPGARAGALYHLSHT